jgi:uncharacterized protein (DUF697 family)
VRSALLRNDTHPKTKIKKGNTMHDLDRTQMETDGETESFEMPEDFEMQVEEPFSQEVEQELANALLEVSDEQELDQFLGDLIQRAARAVGAGLRSPIGRAIGGYLKGAVKKALPIAGGALGGMIAPGIGSTIGSQLGSIAGSALGLEVEELSPEEQDFEVAKRLVRVGGAAVQNVAQTPGADADPKAAARAAVIAAAKAHAPGLLSTQPSNGSTSRRHHPRSGSWHRRGGNIVLVGV